MFSDIFVIKCGFRKIYLLIYVLQVRDVKYFFEFALTENI